MIHYVTGDATQPQGKDPRVIVHCCNDRGLWGRGFVLALSKQWPFAEEAYRAWASSSWKGTPEAWADRVNVSGEFALGEVQFVLVGPKLWVANLIGQRGVGMVNNRPPIRYDAIGQGLQKVCRFLQINEASLHMGRMGAGLAGGRWDAIEQLVLKEVSLKGLSVTVYDLP